LPTKCKATSNSVTDGRESEPNLTTVWPQINLTFVSDNTVT